MTGPARSLPPTINVWKKPSLWISGHAPTRENTTSLSSHYSIRVWRDSRHCSDDTFDTGSTSGHNYGGIPLQIRMRRRWPVVTHGTVGSERFGLRCPSTCDILTVATQTFINRRDAASRIRDHDIATRVYSLVNAIGTQGISSDEEIPLPAGNGKQYSTFAKPWRREALVSLYRHLDLIHAATRNPNGNPIRTRLRTAMVHEDMVIPPKLPEDCYDMLYLSTHRNPTEVHLLRRGPPCGIEELWMGVQAAGAV